MVPRRVLLDRLLEGFPADRIRCNSRVVGAVSTRDGVRIEFEDGSSAEGDLLIGADGLHSLVRDIAGAPPAKPTGWCSWQGLITLPDIADKDVAVQIIGEHGNLGLWPAGGCDLQWWFDLPWSPDFVRPERPIDMIRSNFAGWSDLVDRGTRDVDRRRSGGFAVPAFSASDSPLAAHGRGDVARRCRTHDAAHPRAGDQSGTARHDGVVQGTFGFPERSQRQHR